VGLGAVGGTKREDVAVLLLAVHSTVMVGAASAIWLGRKASERKEKHKQTQGRERAERGAERRARPGLVETALWCRQLAVRNCSNKAFLNLGLPTHNHLRQRLEEARSSCISW